MITTLKKILASTLLILGLVCLPICNLTIAQNPYQAALNTTISGTNIEELITTDAESGKWPDLFNNQIISLIEYVIYVFIALWIAIAFVWWYKIMASEKEESTKDWIRLVIFWVVGVIIMMSAWFISNALVWENGIITEQFVPDEVGETWGIITPNWIQAAWKLYTKILYPFIKLILYFVIWILFFMMAARVISFVTSTDDSVKKKSLWVILWSLIWIFVIMWSKQIVEAVMWKQDTVMKYDATQISWMWYGILEFGRIQLISQVLNWVMGLTMLIVLVLIIIQWYKMFMKPDDSKNGESLKKTLLYVIIWVLVIGASYVISNVLVVNGL